MSLTDMTHLFDSPSDVLDTVTAVSCFILTLLLINLTTKRKDIKFSGIFWFFSLFLMSRCLIHVLIVADIHESWPRFILKIIAAASSAGAAVYAWKIIPTIITMPTLAHVINLNKKLKESIEQSNKEKEEKEKAQSILFQSQKLEAVGQLTGGIAHDFNNLLMAINGNLELIKRNPTSSKVDRWLGNSIESVARAAYLTGQLLTFSRDQKLDLKNIELKSLMMNLKEMITRIIGTNIKIVMEDLDDVIIYADPVQLELALLNLSLNARDAIDRKGVITLSTQRVASYIEINITDTGSGIPEEIVTKIFDPFFTTKDIGKGTGLGLSMVHSVMMQFKGDVYVKQTSPQGTTFTLSLPMVKDDLNHELSLPAQLVDSQHKQVLIVDDEPLVKEALEEMVKSLGYHTHTCDDGIEALTYLKSHRPDLVLCDFAMPTMTGSDVMKSARLIHNHIPFVFVTGYAKSNEIDGCEVLKKPFAFVHIEQLLNRLFDRDQSLVKEVS